MWQRGHGLWQSDRRLRYANVIPGVAAAQQPTTAVVPTVPPTLNGSESIVGIDSSVGSHNINTSGQTFTAGDYVLAVVGTRSFLVTGVAGATDDTYAQEVSDKPDFNPSAAIALWEGSISGALDASINVTLSGSSRWTGGLLTISGAAGNVSQPNVSGTATGTGDTPQAPAITTTVNNTLVLFVFSILGGHSLTGVANASPAGYTFITAVKSTTNNVPTNTGHVTLGIATKVQESAGSVAAASWGPLGGIMAWTAAHYAIAPA